MAAATLEKTLTDFTDTVSKKVKSHDDRLDKIDKALSKPVYPEFTRVTSADEQKEKGKWGWKSLNHQLADVRRAEMDSAFRLQLKDKLTKALKIWGESRPNYDHEDPAFVLKAAQGLGEAVGPDGGFLLAPTYAEGVLEILHKEENLLDRCDKYEMASASLKIRAIDETSRVTGSRWGGVQGYWTDEGSSLTASKPKFRMIDLIPHKLATLFYATEELLADGGSMLEQMTSRLMAKEINFLIGAAIINGTGAGQPLGILNAAALITVSADTGQQTKTITTTNIENMWARLHRSAQENAIWLIHQDTQPQLYTMSLAVGTAGVVTFMPPGGVSEKPYATLMGRPLIITEFMQTLGTVGDIILADMKSIIAATRGTVMAASSMHIAFLTDEMAFRLTFRVAAQPWWHSALTPFKGTNTQSPLIALASR